MARWTTIKVPQELKNKIKLEAEKRGMSQWELVALAISTLSSAKQLQQLDNMDKISYYIMKISYSVSALKIDPSTENLEWLRKTAQQIQQRLGIDTSTLIKAAENYMRKKDKKSIGVLNMTWKLAIKKMIALLAEEA